MSKGRRGISMDSIMKPSTAKERADYSARHRDQRLQKKRIKKKLEHLYGNQFYDCSNCKNRIRNHGFGDRKIFCSVCHNGFYELVSRK